MGGIPLAALAVQQPPSPLKQYGEVLGIQNAQQEQQLRQQQIQGAQLANQQAQYQFGATKAMNEAYKGAVTVDENGQPKFDTDKLTKSLAGAGYGSEVPTILKHVTDFQKSQADLVKTNTDVAKTQQEMRVQQSDMMGSVGAAIKAAGYDPGFADTFLQHYEINNPTQKPQIDQFRAQLQQNPGMVKQLADQWIAGSPKQQQFANEQEVAKIRATGGAENRELNAALQSGAIKNESEWPAYKAQQEAGVQLNKSIAEATNPQIQGAKLQLSAAEGQARANVEANMARGSSAALAQVPPHLVGPASAAATKAGEDYAQAKSVSDRLDAMLGAAKQGNVVSYQLIPQEGALQVTTSQGVHRINMAEIANYGGGSLWQRLEGHIGKQLTGKSIPDSVLNDMAEIQSFMARGSQAKYENSLKTINQNYGSNFAPVQMEGMPQAPQGYTPPKGAATATGPNGHRIVVDGGRWVDAQTGKPI